MSSPCLTYLPAYSTLRTCALPILSDGNAYSTLYGHMRSVATSAGKYVKQGELIGYVGSTGNSTGNHLHLEVWKGGSKANAVNPRGYIPMK